MSGIVAAIAHPGQTLEDGEVAGLADAYQQLRGPGEVHVRRAGQWGQAALVDGEVPGRREDRGDDWGLASGAAHVRGSLAAASPDDLDGQFAAIAHDAARGELRIIGDPFGMQSLYVAQRDGRTYASTCATALARHLGAEPDPLGIEVFLRAGYHCGPVTHWKGIERLEPGTCLVATRDGVRRQTWWLTQVDERVRRLSFDATVDHLVEVAVERARAYLGDAPCSWMDLTGGFDSRLAAAVVLTAGLRPMTNTVGTEADADVQLAREIAQVAGLPWQRFGMPEGWAPDVDELSRAAAWADGTLDVLQLSNVLARHASKAEACRMLVTGGGLEHVSAYPWLHAPWAGRTHGGLARATVRFRYLKGSASPLLARDPTARVAGYLRACFEQRAALHADGLTTEKLDELYAYKSVGHFGAYRSASEAHVRQEMPAYWRDVFTTTFSANHRWRNGHRLHRGVIERLRPDLAGIATTRGGPAEQFRLRRARRFLPYYQQLAEKSVRRVRGAASPSAGGGRLAFAYGTAVRRLREQGVLDPSTMHSAFLLDGSALTATVDRATAPGFTAWGALGRVATVELALRGGAGA